MCPAKEKNGLENRTALGINPCHFLVRPITQSFQAWLFLICKQS